MRACGSVRSCVCVCVCVRACVYACMRVCARVCARVFALKHKVKIKQGYHFSLTSIQGISGGEQICFQNGPECQILAALKTSQHLEHIVVVRI